MSHTYSLHIHTHIFTTSVIQSTVDLYQQKLSCIKKMLFRRLPTHIPIYYSSQSTRSAAPAVCRKPSCDTNTHLPNTLLYTHSTPKNIFPGLFCISLLIASFYSFIHRRPQNVFTGIYYSLYQSLHFIPPSLSEEHKRLFVMIRSG